MSTSVSQGNWFAASESSPCGSVHYLDLDPAAEDDVTLIVIELNKTAGPVPSCQACFCASAFVLLELYLVEAIDKRLLPKDQARAGPSLISFAPWYIHHGATATLTSDQPMPCLIGSPGHLSNIKSHSRRPIDTITLVHWLSDLHLAYFLPCLSKCTAIKCTSF